MSNLTRPSRNGSNGSFRTPADVEFYALDDKLREEMKLLAEVNTELLGKHHTDPEMQLGASPSGQEDPEAIAALRQENAHLANRLVETEQLLEQAVAHEESWLERQKDYEALLDEKSEVIRGLHLKVKELQLGQTSVPASKPATGKPVEDEGILRLRRELEEERRQLRQDEEALMKQMREMEMAMSRDRAELARQRNEMQRLQAELNHEIEMASRDPLLRDRLQSLQRRQQESLTRKGGAASTKQQHPSQEKEPQQQATPEEPTPRKSGFFGRLFGK